MSGFEDRARKAAEAVRQQIDDQPLPNGRELRRVQRPARRWIAPSAAAVALAVAAVTVPGLVGGGSSAGPGATSAMAAPLKPFSDCDDVRAYFAEHAADYLIGQAQRNVGFASSAGGSAPGRAESTSGFAARDDSKSAATPQYSTTNVQEAGVDEPDVVKTDGKIIAAVAQGRVHLIEARNGKLTPRKTLPTTDVEDIFLLGHRVLVFSRSTAPEGKGLSDQAVLTTFDITRLEAPRRVSTLRIEGEVLDARLVGHQVRVATSSTPDVDIASPAYTDDGKITEESKRQLREAVARAGVDDWIPTYTLTDAAGRVTKGRLVSCSDLARPDTFSGLDTVAVSAFDITSTFTGTSAGTDRHAAGVVAGGQQLYASDTATYITSTDWTQDQPTVSTQVHKFVTAASGATAYRGSGTVRGALLNQYAMSENAGVLRVASTFTDRRGWTSPRTVNEGAVTTFGESNGELRQLGQVDGLGRSDNESIQAVRFIGDRGYVVTYRQTDPLYVLDLSNPAAPTVIGQLKIPGYSGYLHPVGPNLLLGVGQSGEDEGKQKGESGVQFSLFDVSNPASPRRIDTQTYGGGDAQAEWDPKAFLYWAPRKLVVAPVILYGDEKERGAFTGVVLLRTDAKGLKQVGRIAVRTDEMANRSFVIGDYVYVLTDQSLQSHALTDTRRVDRLSF